MENSNKNFVFVAGSAMLDIISKITEYRHIQDNLGKTKLCFGGEAYNIASILKNKNIPTTICTALNNSAVSQMILNDIAEKQIRTHILKDEYLSNAVYNGIFHKGNELISVWGRSISNAKFSDSFIKKGLNNANSLVITTCLGAENCSKFIKEANKLHIPVFLVNISLMESEIINNIEGKIDYIFLKDNEMNFLRDSIDPCLSWQDIALQKNTNIIINKKASSIEIIKPEGEIKIFSTQNISKVKSSTYLKDFIIGLTVNNIIFKNLDLDSAIEDAIDNAETSIDFPNLVQKDSFFTNTTPQIINPSHYDTVSGALNKEGLKHFLSSDQFTDDIKFLAVDIHDFNKVTNKFEQQTKDEAIIEILDQIKQSLRNRDFVVRLEEDKFICVLTQAPKEQIEKIKNRISKSIESQSFTESELKFKVSTSITKYKPENTITLEIKKVLTNIKKSFNN